MKKYAFISYALYSDAGVSFRTHLVSFSGKLPAIAFTPNEVVKTLYKPTRYGGRKADDIYLLSISVIDTNLVDIEGLDVTDINDVLQTQNQ